MNDQIKKAFDETKKPLIGIQGSVMAFADPWHGELLSNTYKRTGEGQMFPVQDGAPDSSEFIEMIKAAGADFYVHHPVPEELEERKFVQSIKKENIGFILGNEVGTINTVWKEGTNRYDISSAAVEEAKDSVKFMGLIYDETEHNQLHPDIYFPENPGKPRYQWTDPAGKTLDEIETHIIEAVGKVKKHYGAEVDLYSEQVFPVMYHIFANGGMNLCPKVLKEEFQSLQLSTALGASVQYKRKMGICVDLWGPDVGSWFTRLWGFPGHSAQEFEQALRLAYYYSPEFLFVENIDPLVRYKEGKFQSTEFGEVFERFTKVFVPSHPLPYSYAQAVGETVLIRSDDSHIAESGSFFGLGPFGSKQLRGNDKMDSVFDAFNLLSRGKLPDNGLTFFLPEYTFPKGLFPATSESITELPRVHGERSSPGDNEKTCSWQYIHKLWHPLHNVLVCDHHAGFKDVREAKLIVLAGSRMTDECLKAVLQRTSEGALCISVPWLLPRSHRSTRKIGRGHLLVTENLTDAGIADAADQLLGNPEIWSQRFGNYELHVANPEKDEVSLEFEVIKR
jgi:hypothetical protein